MDTPDPDPRKCECHGWTYADAKENTWAMVESSTGEWIPLGHHPSCEYWVRPPHPILTGLVPIKPAELAEALRELSISYSELAKRIPSSS